MAGALAVEGWIIGLFVIIDGIYIVAFPPVNDEAQGYAIIAIGIFIILATLHLTKIMEKNGNIQGCPKGQAPIFCSRAFRPVHASKVF